MCLKQENPTRVVVISVSLSWNSFLTSVSDLCSFDTFSISWKNKTKNRFSMLIVSSHQTLASSKCVLYRKPIYTVKLLFFSCFVFTLPHDPNSYPISNFLRQISQSNDFVPQSIDSEWWHTNTKPSFWDTDIILTAAQMGFHHFLKKILQNSRIVCDNFKQKVWSHFSLCDLSSL